jgi:hypothetical protein
MRKSSIFFITIAAASVFLFLMFVHAGIMQNNGIDSIQDKRGVVQALKITDLCLFTEARYTRHLSQADLNTAFQDHPTALEHFPSGSLMSPPSGLQETR